MAGAETTYAIVQHGPLEETSRLLQIKKGEFAHAIVAWRAADVITLLSYYPIEGASVESFKKFFSKEVDLHLAMFESTGAHILDLPDSNEGGTPTRVHKKASEASMKLVTPCRFGSKRSRID